MSTIKRVQILNSRDKLANSKLSKSTTLDANEMIQEHIESLGVDGVDGIECIIELVDIELSMVNSLRRIILSYIPIVGVNPANVHIETNTTSLLCILRNFGWRSTRLGTSKKMIMLHKRYLEKKRCVTKN